MLHYIHKLAANFVLQLSGAEHVASSTVGSSELCESRETEPKTRKISTDKNAKSWAEEDCSQFATTNYLW